ncbi:MAG: valine--tRNA ligase [Puniceicoccales bacterium]|jgi:valyl-tRNA synthetase|nr:valine--tRNA ligase [Puniceicoccales bacterium]
MIDVSYVPGDLEQKWYAKWLENNLFTRKISDQKIAYAIPIPPPNVTGILHMGHILNSTIQDVLIRYARQKNKSVLWIPGTDHAGISLQIKVEKELARQGKTRYDLGREAFLTSAKRWRDQHGTIILEQLKKLGVSCDWSAMKHTLDPDYSHAVLSAFVKLYRQGYIYKGVRFVNWCPVTMTALSDEEVIMRQQHSLLYYIKYEIVERPEEFLVVATTRPETIMGDVAIAVHLDDERYNNLIGLHCWQPIGHKFIPIIGDKAVLQDFGTGVLKITPAHDATDFEIGQRHGLATVSVIDKDGRLNRWAGQKFQGMDRFEARQRIEADLQEKGALWRTEDYVNYVGFSERAGVPVEPVLSEQWFLKYPRVEEAKIAIREKMIRFRPEHWTKTYAHWLDNLKDWCISRQLWWGHRIPVWYQKGMKRDDPKHWHVSVDCPKDPENWEQDEDVLDTWFSSAIWPLATLGWPNKEAMAQMGFDYFYPMADLVTGPDIIFFWVARMVMSGLNLLGDEETDSSMRGEALLPHDEIQRRIPFKNVYFTGIIRDAQGQKMSKSLGNSPDPLDLIEKYGADGVRIGLLSMAPKGQDILFAEERVAQGKKLCTKLWNAFRFRQQSSLDGDRSSITAIVERIDDVVLEVDDRAILKRLLIVVEEFEHALENYEFNCAVQTLYTFFWNHYCDWYIEISKVHTNASVLAIHDLLLRQLLLLFHPFIPFITEELWHAQAYGTRFLSEEPLESRAQLRKYLKKIDLSHGEQFIAEIDAIQALVVATRALKAQYGLSAKRNVQFYFKADSAAEGIIQHHLKHIKYLLLTKLFDRTNEVLQLPAVVTTLGVFYIDVAGSLDVAAERERLQREIEQLEQYIEISKKKLHNEDFLTRAPESVIAGVQDLLDENVAKSEELKANFLKLSALVE